jgi:CheY-like chemotaxis protein
MHQIIMNLCTNAAHAMRESGGVLRVELVQEDVDAQAASRVAGLTPGSYVVLSVRDQGVGMDPATVPRVFEPFFTTKKSGEGTGLGLSVVLGIVHSHGSGIAVESVLGSGSTFRVYLPSAPGATESAPRSPEADAAASGEHVLVVDDEPEIAGLLERLLVAKGYRVTAFTSGEEALAAFRREPDVYRAVITDHTMPRLAGVELARQVKALRPGTPVILTTGYGDKISSVATGSDVDAVAAKPFDTARLTQTLRRVLARD